jgi:hypothetical protein
MEKLLYLWRFFRSPWRVREFEEVLSNTLDYHVRRGKIVALSLRESEETRDYFGRISKGRLPGQWVIHVMVLVGADQIRHSDITFRVHQVVAVHEEDGTVQIDTPPASP